MLVYLCLNWITYSCWSLPIAFIYFNVFLFYIFHFALSVLNREDLSLGVSGIAAGWTVKLCVSFLYISEEETLVNVQIIGEAIY